MNTDIRIAVSFPSHPKTVKLTKKLGPQGPLSLIYLWIFASQNKPNGKLSGMDEEDISIAAQWPKAPKIFIEALCHERFISCHNGTFELHDWADHNPYAVHSPERSERAKKAAAARWGGDDAQKCYEHKQALPLASTSNAPSPAPSPIPAPSPEPAGEHAEPPVDNSPEDNLPPFEEVPEPGPEGKSKSSLPAEKQEQKKQPPGNTHGERWTDQQNEKLDALMTDILARWKQWYHQQVCAWVQANYNSKNPDAMARCLERLIADLLAGKKIPYPGRWLDAALNGNKDHPGENGKFEAEESEREHEARKAEETRDVGRMVAGIGRMM